MVGAYAGFMIAIIARFCADPSIFGFVVTLFGSMVIAAAIGMAIERFAYRPVRKFSRMTTLITAIGMSLLSNIFSYLSFRERRDLFRI